MMVFVQVLGSGHPRANVGKVSFYLCSVLNRLKRGRMKEISEKKLHIIRITYMKDTTALIL